MILDRKSSKFSLQNLPMIKNFKEMPTCIRHRTRVTIHKIEVFFSYFPDKRLKICKQGRISQISFGCHNGIRTRFFQTPLNIRPVLDISISYDRNVDSSSKSKEEGINITWDCLEIGGNKYLIARMCFQLAKPVSGPFCSRVRPWTVKA